jgi:hypothetical protein
MAWWGGPAARPKAIRQAGVFLACLSSQSVGKVGYVQNEFRLALSAFGERPSGTTFLIPVRLDDCAVPDLQIPDFGLNLEDIQWVDLWQEGGFDRLVRAIKKTLEDPNQAQRHPGPAGGAHDQAPVHIAPDGSQPKAVTVLRDVNEPWCPELVVIPPGGFMMGSTGAERQWAIEQGAKQERIRRNRNIGSR